MQQILIVILLLLSIYYFINIGNQHLSENKKIIITKFNILISCIFLLLIIVLYNIINNKSIIKEIISLIFYSVIFSYILNPIVNYLEKRNIKRSCSILLIYLFVISIFTFMLFTLVPEITKEFGNLIRLIPDYIDDLNQFFYKFYLKHIQQIEDQSSYFNNINTVFLENLNKIEQYMLEYFKKRTKSVAITMTNSIKFSIVPVISFYFLKDKELFKKKLCSVVPIKHRADLIKVCKKIDLSLLNFLKGQIITSIIVGILSVIALSIIKIEFAVIIGITIAIFEIVPYLGPLVGIVLTIIFGLLQSPTKAIWGVLLLLLVQQIENSIIAPKIMGESVGLHPVIVIILVIIGAGYFGLMGMILAVPVTSIIKTVSLFLIDKILEE